MALIKQLKKNGKSSYVHLVRYKDEFIVKKKYNPNIVEHYMHFKNEVRILNHLKECPFVPRLIEVDHKNLILYLTYCGDSLDKFKLSEDEKEYRQEEIKKLVKRLGDEWHVYRIVGGKHVHDITFNNVCMNSKDMFLIDFGSPYWIIKK
jgi:tRNA A-37 threonylcarbamoyl transferase component Bud32